MLDRQRPGVRGRARWTGLVWILLGLAFLILVVPFVVGSFLPEEYVGSGERTLSKAPEVVWAAVGDFEKHPVSGDMAQGVERLADQDGRDSWREDLGSTTVTVATLEASSPNYLVRELMDEKLPMTARWTFKIDPVGDGCVLKVDQRLSVRDGTWHVPYFRCVLRFTGAADRAVNDYLDRIAAHLGT